METNKIKIFKNDIFGEVRVTEVNGEPMFCLLDVARALEYAHPAKAVIDHCKGVTVLETPTTNQHGAVVMQNIKFGKESEVYRLIMKAKTERAEKFQDWVCGEVLPDIRKHGMFITAETIMKTMSDPDNLIKLLSAYSDEKKRSAELQAHNAQLAEANSQLETQSEELRCENGLMHDKIQADKPLVDFANAVANSDSIITITDLAKLINQNGIDIGGKRLCEWMRQNGYLCNKNGFNNAPTQRAMDLGLFRVTEFAMASSKGTRIAYSTKVTAKGQQYFINKFIQQHRAA